MPKNEVSLLSEYESYVYIHISLTKIYTVLKKYS